MVQDRWKTWNITKLHNKGENKMTISELIKRLRMHEKEYGNSDVMVLRHNYEDAIQDDIWKTEWDPTLKYADAEEGIFFIRTD